MGYRTFLLLWMGLFCLCFGLQSWTGRWFPPRTPHGLFDVESTRVSQALLRTGEFRDPFAGAPTGPSAHVAPAYPLLYSAVMRVFGTEWGGFLAIRGVTIAAYTAGWALLPWLAVLMNLRARSGFLSALVGASLPVPGRCYKWEALFVSSCLVVLTYLTLRWSRHQNLKLALALGTVWGATILLNPAVACVWVVYAGWMSLRGGRQDALQMSAIWLLPWLVASPWLVRNYRVFGQFVFVRDNLGLELRVSNNDCASSWLQDNLDSGCAARFHPNDSLEAARQVATRGEVRFNALQLKMAAEWIRAHPRQFLALTVQRFGQYWFPRGSREKGLVHLNMMLVCLLTGLMIPGLLLARRTNRLAALLLAGCLASFPLMHYVVQVDLRYRYPILWISVFLGCVTVCSVLTSCLQWSGRHSLLKGPPLSE